MIFSIFIAIVLLCIEASPPINLQFRDSKSIYRQILCTLAQKHPSADFKALKLWHVLVRTGFGRTVPSIYYHCCSPAIQNFGLNSRKRSSLSFSQWNKREAESESPSTFTDKLPADRKNHFPKGRDSKITIENIIALKNKSRAEL